MLVWQHRVVNSLIDFLSELLILLIMKNERIMSEWVMRSKNEWFAHFWWVPWAIRSHCSFLVSNLSDSLTSLIKKRTKNVHKCTKKYDCSQIFWANCSFFVNKRANERFTQKNKQLAHLLIYHEQPELIAHSCSFVLSNLSESLSVAHLIWEVWANRSQSLIWSEQSERMSEFLTLWQPFDRKL